MASKNSSIEEVQVESDDEDDMQDHYLFSKDFQYFCNSTVSKRCALKYQLQAMKDPNAPKLPEEKVTSFESASWPAVMYGFFNSIVWAQVINKTMDIQPNLERSSHLEVALYKQLVGALNNLKSKTLKSSDILPKLKEKEAARDAALVNYINASKNMEKRIERDQNLLQEDNPSVDTTLALFRRKLLRLQYLRVLIMGLVSHGNLDYVKNPEYILMMKRYKKKLTTELIVDAVRVFSDDDDQMSSSISAAEQ